MIAFRDYQRDAANRAANDYENGNFDELKKQALVLLTKHARKLLHIQKLIERRDAIIQAAGDSASNEQPADDDDETEW